MTLPRIASAAIAEVASPAVQAPGGGARAVGTMPEGVMTAREALVARAARGEQPAAVGGVADVGHLLLMAGQPKVTWKTMQGADLVVARTIGGVWMGTDVARHSGVAVVATETPAEEFAARVLAFARGRGLSDEQVEDVMGRTIIIGRQRVAVPHLEMREQMRSGFESARQLDRGKKVAPDRNKAFKFAETARFGDTTIVKWLEDLDDVALVIFDSFGFHAGVKDENDAVGVATQLQAYRELASYLKSLVVVIHHTGKDGRNIRGSSAFEAEADAIITIAPPGRSGYCTAGFSLRSYPERPDHRYRLKTDGEALSFSSPPGASESDTEGAPDPALVADVRAVLTACAKACTVTRIRELVQAHRGKSGKARADGVESALRALERQGAVRTSEARSRTGVVTHFEIVGGDR